MKNRLSSQIRKRAVSVMLILAFAASGTMYAFADTYDIYNGSISVTADETTNYVTQENNPDAQNKPDNDVVITGGTDTNTITVDAGATVTIQDANIFFTDSSTGKIEDSPLTITDKDNKGEAATVIIEDSYIGLCWDDNNPDNVPAVLVEEGATLDLQVDGYVEFDGYRGNENAPAIQLEDGATLNLSDHGDGGDLYVYGAIGTAAGSDANVTININENEQLYMDLQTFTEPDGGSSAAIGTGANSTGSADININGGVIDAYILTHSDDAEAIGNGSGATGNTVVNFDGEPYVEAYNYDATQMITVKDDEATKIYEVTDPEAFSAAYNEAEEEAYNEVRAEAHRLESELYTLLREKGVNISDGGFFDSYEDYVKANELMENDPEVKAANDAYREYSDNMWTIMRTTLYKKLFEKLDDSVINMVYDSSAVPEEPTDEPDEPEDEPEDEPADGESAEEPAETAQYITAGAFAASLVSMLGKYIPEIEALRGGTYKETFENFKAYVENNKLFDTDGLTAGKKLTAGQIAVVLCKAANISVSGEEDALAKLQEKGILKGYTVDSVVPAAAVQAAMNLFIREFIENK